MRRLRLAPLALLPLVAALHGVAAPGAAADAKPTLGLRYPSLTPDGRAVVFDYRGDIWRAPLDGKAHADRLTINDAQDTLPRVSPDGTQVAFSSRRAGGYDLYVMPIDGGLPDVQKRFHSVVVRGANIGGGTQVVVQARQGVMWTTIGTVTANRGEVVFSAGGYVASQLVLRLDLQGTSAASPCLREVGVTYDVMSAPLKVVEFEALIAPGLRLLDGTTEANTPTTLLAGLEALRAGTAVVDLADPVVSATAGSALKVRVSDVTIEALLSEPKSGQYGWVARVSCEVVG